MHEQLDTQVTFNEVPAKSGLLGIITLNRPEALNALTAYMVEAITAKLNAWAIDNNIHAVIIMGAGDKAFCAGGDLKQWYVAGAVNYEQAIPFFRYEYNLTKIIYHYPKPYIALLNGFAMGGGLGVSIHGSHVIASETLKLAMPENGIGLYPDVGASYFLSRCPKHIGMYMGLTGAIINTADAIYAGLVGNCIPKAKFGEFINAVCAHNISELQHIINNFNINTGPSQLIEHLPIIETCFNKNSVEEIISALEKNNSAWALEQVKILNTKSPTSLKVAFKSITLGANMTMEQCMAMEFNLSLQFLQGQDLYEGIRAVIIDKTHDAKWQPATLAAVSTAMLDELFRLKCKL